MNIARERGFRNSVIRDQWSGIRDQGSVVTDQWSVTGRCEGNRVSFDSIWRKSAPNFAQDDSLFLSERVSYGFGVASAEAEAGVETALVAVAPGDCFTGGTSVPAG